MTTALEEYYEALDRLKGNRPLRAPKGTRITNDAVSLEAGRGKGSIKKSRALFADLIFAIDAAAAEQVAPAADGQEKLAKTKAQVERYRVLYEEAIAREVSLLKENFELKRELKRLGGPTILASGRERVLQDVP
ncbi:hypothetical protein [Massilia sp. NP310]|uniref:hypothetical protein n=1 Tax=Massilia sp. NP310 TaxID=2861282 RepID=UPI001C63A1DE|nr:hypothetical protein [Massilia sp. NP310]QYG03945.1 hypothetical protein KY496_11475 [Massilia sp. NP310]